MNNIVRETSGDIKRLAKIALKDNWLKVFVGCLLYSLMITYIPQFCGLLLPEAVLNIPIPEGVVSSEGLAYKISYVVVLYTTFLTPAFSLGITVFILSFLRKKDIQPAYIFSGFDFYLKALGLFLIKALFIYLWSLLFLIPGIIASYSYSQAFYILADDPKKGIMQCITESKRMMQGNKGNRFVLDLSFIPLMLLGMLPVIVFSAYTGAGDSAIGLSSASFAQTSPFANFFIILALSIPQVMVYTYLYTSQGIFYELASGHLVARLDTENTPPRMY